MTLLNLTPHPVVLHLPDGATRELPPSSVPSRIAEVVEPEGGDGDIPLVRVRYADSSGLPDPRPGVLLIVSTPVALACPDRRDLVTPHDFVRDASGRILGCRALARRAH